MDNNTAQPVAAPVAPATPAAPAAPVVTPAAAAPAAPAQPAAAAPVTPAAAPNQVDVFKQKYQALVQETGLSINVEPKYIKRDDGSYSTILETTILPVR